MKLSDDFYLWEAEKSHMATRLGITNHVPGNLIPLVRHVAREIVQPVRDNYGVPIVFNGGLSWYRGPELNAALRGSETSQHCEGEAVDLEVPGVSNYELALWIMNNLKFDQLILERHVAEVPRSGWVHVSLKLAGTNRQQVLTSPDGKIFLGGLQL
jgi:hypothetical protein